MIRALRGGRTSGVLPAELSRGMVIFGRREKKMSTTSTSSTPTTTFHRRKLPDSLIALSSPNGRTMFKEALETHTMESFFPLSEQFITQSEPSYCSLSSLAMVLNALNHDPKRTWKGVWRWVTEDTLQCESHNILCKHSTQKIQTEGMDFKDFESLGECHKVIINSFRSPNLRHIQREQEEYTSGLSTFREHVMNSCTMKNPGGEGAGVASAVPVFFVISNFSRKVLGQTGDGHFSPIGGYHISSDSVLILDVARFKYPPYWVPLSTLWEAMAEEDRATGSPRGYFLVRSS